MPSLAEIKTHVSRRRRFFYTDKQLARKTRAEYSAAERRFFEFRQADFSPRVFLMRSELYHLAQNSGLTPQETRLLEILLSGACQREAAGVIGVSHTVINRRYASLRRKIQTARSAYPFAELWEIYEQETIRKRRD